MTESKSQEKYFPYPLKQEGYENTFNWQPAEAEFDDFRNSSSHFMGRQPNRSQLFENFNPLSMNPDMAHEAVSMTNQSNNIDVINAQNDQSSRMNSSFPLFNEKILASNNAPSEINIGQLHPTQYPTLLLDLDTIGMNKVSNIPRNNIYFPYSVP